MLSAVSFLSDNDSYESERVLIELEDIDDECNHFGIDLVKINDPESFEVFNVTTIPAVALIRKQATVFYDG